MKRSALQRKTPLRATKPMTPSATRLRARKPVADKPKRAAHDNEDRHLLDLCRGQPCYLLLPGIRCSGIETVVPAHSNSYASGKGMGIKARHAYTVPACHACHIELDQGMRFSKEEKFALWDSAYARWEPMRQVLLNSVIL